jgi:hypothetical protein
VPHGLNADPTFSAALTPRSNQLHEPGPAAAAPPAASVPAHQTTCANCHAPLTGHFCGQCGAPRLEERPLTVHRFVGDLWNEVTSIDSGTVRTLRALFLKPGLLTREYLDGRTRWYLSPVRLFLLTIALYLFAHSALGLQRQDEETLHKASIKASWGIAVRKAQEAAAQKASGKPVPGTLLVGKAAEKKRIQRETLNSMASTVTSAEAAAVSNQWLQLITPLAIAGVLALIFLRKRRSYAEHVVHALHLISFMSILKIAINLVQIAHGDAHHTYDICFVLFWVIFARYFYLSAQRVYGDSSRRTAVDAGLFAVGGQTALFVLPAGVAVLMTLWVILSMIVRVWTL